MTAGRPVAVVAGYSVRFPLAGMTWVTLHHLLGLRALGFEPVYVEAALWPESCYDPDLDAMTEEPTTGVEHLRRAARWVGLDDLSIWYVTDDGRDAGMGRDEAEALLARADVLVNVGASTWHPAWASVPCRILLDCDAPFTQLAIADGVEPLSGIARNHDVWATLAGNVAAGRCPGVPLDRRWIAARPPVHTAAWAPSPLPDGGAWTTVTSWGSTARREWQGTLLGNKADGYERLLDLPARTDVTLELAVASDAPTDDLAQRGWRVVDPVPPTHDVWDLVDYVRSSCGELAVAKDAYRTVRTGAMNDRSLAYLASGRPVVATDTGLGDVEGMPELGAGLLLADGPEATARAIAAVEADPVHHAAAARRLAEERFEAADVLADLLSAAGVRLPAAEVTS